jgi:hypothetical protein
MAMIKAPRKRLYEFWPSSHISFGSSGSSGPLCPSRVARPKAKLF